MAFREQKDIINRGLALLGKERIRTLTEHSTNAAEGVASYDNMRLAELRRNLWTFATRRVILRPIDADTVLWTPGAYNAATTYGHGAVVVYNSDWWESQAAANTGNTPEAGANWQHYYGADTADPYDATTSYLTGELVVGSDTAVYRSLVTGNAVDPVAVGTGWLAIGGTTAALSILYPIGSGPQTDNATRNVFRLPRGFLRKAPTDPKAGVTPYLGGPANAAPDTWVFEGGYIVAPDTGPILLRFIADVTDVTMMDPMFCEALAACIAADIAPRVLAGENASEQQAKIGNARYAYKTKRAEAIIVNGIEVGPVEPFEDDYVLVRY